MSEFDGSVTVFYDDTPTTVNKGGGGSRGHWSKGHKEKQRWEGVYLALFLQAKLPRRLDFVRVHILLEYARPNTKRDPENFRHPVVKPLADAFVKAGYLKDDNPDYFDVGSLTISRDKLDAPKTIKSRITVTIDYRLASADPEPYGLAAPAPGGAAGATGRDVGDDAHARRTPTRQPTRR
jgi:hypothetical protein